jgi:hypothetical protein
MVIGFQYVLTAAAVQLTDPTILNIPQTGNPTTGTARSTKAFQLRIRNATGAANAIYLGLSNVTNVPANAFAQAGAGELIEFGPFAIPLIELHDLYLVGTVNAANLCFIEAVI